MTFTVLGGSGALLPGREYEPENVVVRRGRRTRHQGRRRSRSRHPGGPDGHSSRGCFAERDGSVAVEPAGTRLTDRATVRALAPVRHFLGNPGPAAHISLAIEGRGAGRGVARSCRSGRDQRGRWA